MSSKRQTAADEPFHVVRAAAADLPRGFVLDHHAHPWPQLIYASAGVMTVWTQEGSWIAPPRWAVWAPANVRHGIRFSGQSAMRTLYLRPQECAGLPTQCSVIAVSPLLRELILRTVEIGMLDERTPSHCAMARLIVVKSATGRRLLWTCRCPRPSRREGQPNRSWRACRPARSPSSHAGSG